jgi:8-oxo-dGTP diphosphatase
VTPRKKIRTEPTKKHSYPYARKALMVDAVVLGLVKDCLQILLVQKPKFGWVLPGGHVEIQETVEEAIHRELFEEAHVKGVFLRQLHVFSELDRDPREPTISVAFYALVRPELLKIQAGTGTSHAKWFAPNDLPRMGFDHRAIIEKSFVRISQEIKSQPLAQPLLPEQFTMSQLHNVHQQLVRKPLDPKNFRRDMLKKGLLEEAEDLRPRWQMDRRPAPRTPKFYRFTSEPV